MNTMRRASSPAICLKTTVMAFAFDGDRILLVLFGGGRIHGIQELSPLIAHIANDAAQSASGSRAHQKR